VQLDAPLLNEPGVPSGCLLQHHWRGIHTSDDRFGCLLGNRMDQRTGATPDIKDTIVGLDIQQCDRPTHAS
jgi:hypothetical protein